MLTEDRISLRLPPALSQGLKVLYQGSGMTQSEYLRWLIERQLESMHAPPGMVRVNLALSERVMQKLDALAFEYGWETQTETVRAAVNAGIKTYITETRELTSDLTGLQKEQLATAKKEAYLKN